MTPFLKATGVLALSCTAMFILTACDNKMPTVADSEDLRLAACAFVLIKTEGRENARQWEDIKAELIDREAPQLLRCSMTGSDSATLEFIVRVKCDGLLSECAERLPPRIRISES